MLKVGLLAFVRFDLFLDLILYRIKVEGRRRLHRLKLDGCFRQLRHCLLYDDEAPELTRHKAVQVVTTSIVQTFSADWRRYLTTDIVTMLLWFTTREAGAAIALVETNAATTAMVQNFNMTCSFKVT